MLSMRSYEGWFPPTPGLNSSASVGDASGHSCDWRGFEVALVHVNGMMFDGWEHCEWR